MKINQQMLLLLFLILIIIFLIYQRSFENEKPTCNNYISTIYLYVILGILITYFAVLFIAKRRFPITTTKSLLFFVIALGAIFAMYNVESNKVLINHFWWVIFIIAMSVLVYSVWRYSQYRGILVSSLVITVLWVFCLTMLVHIKPEWISLNWGSALISALFIGILAWLVPLFFSNRRKQEMTVYYKLLSAFFVFVFSMLILYDTKLLRIKGETCSGIPDYPKDSMGLFLDIINMFANVNFIR